MLLKFWAAMNSNTPTHLMWHNTFPKKKMTASQARLFAKNLHHDGFSNWQIPAHDELQDLFITPLYSLHHETKTKKPHFWWHPSMWRAYNGDKYAEFFCVGDDGNLWTISFGIAHKECFLWKIHRFLFEKRAYLRCVRGGKQ